MPADLEDRLRSALRSIPEPGEEVGARLRRRALDDFPRPRRRLLRRATRLVRPALAALALAAVATVVALLLVAAPSDDEPAGQETGVQATLRAIPYRPGDDGADAARRLAEALTERGMVRGIDGLQAEASGDRVTLFIPRVHDVGWFDALLMGFEVAVFDTRRSVAVHDRSLAAVLAAAEREIPPGDPGRFYAVVAGPGAGSGYIAGPAGDPEGARRLAPDVGPPARVARVPADTWLARAFRPRGAGPGRAEFAALRDPVAGPSDIASVIAEGTDLILVIEEGARERVAAEVEARLATGGAALEVVTGPSSPVSFQSVRFSGYDEARGALVFAGGPTAGVLARELAGGGVDAGLVVEDARPVGPAPVRRGERPATVPAQFRRMAEGDFADDPFRPRNDTLLRVIDTTHAGARWQVWTFLAANGRELVGTDGPGPGDGTGDAIGPPSTLRCIRAGVDRAAPGSRATPSAAWATTSPRSPRATPTGRARRPPSTVAGSCS